MATAITESLRAEHRALLAKLDVLRVLGRTVDTGKPGQTDTVLDAAISMLRRDLLPHAHAEEAVLYPAVERAIGAPGAMATMVAAIAGRIPRGDQIEDLRAQVLGLWAILLLHFEKEEDSSCPCWTSTSPPTGHG
jgi:iron-sulfur cluster repair protein YtfE (RIC family)